MSEGRWARVGELFHDLAGRPQAEQEAALSALVEAEPELAEELRSLLTADRQSDRLPEHAWLPAPEVALPAGAAIGLYRIVGELARGGMGIVYRAERADGAFERQVAIKLARPDLVSPALGERFAEERRILATLDHPGIARLLDAGTTPDDRLFLVLELVEGERLDRWSAAKSLGQRLTLFLAVCEAVEHAHRRLVLHRDLKPANILVTAEARPKLLDFGIARLLGEDAGPGEATRLGLRPLTPEYASPEQLRGEPLSTASDIYALGIVLFELLTDRRPYELAETTSPEERARRIATDPLPRASATLRRAGSASAVQPRLVEGDLDAIVGRALAPDPAERYVSVENLAADVRRYLAGRPVEARSPTLIERGGKFVRRHRAAVAVATAFVFVLVGATAFSWRQAAIASAERERAVRRFADLRELARVFLFELPDRIERLPGATGARELLVKTGLTYLDRLREDGGRDPVLLAELASGYERLGQVQAGFFAANVGETADALATFDRALELRRELAVPGGGDEAVRRLAEAQLLRATALFKNGHMAEALAAAEQAAELGGTDEASAADDPEIARLRAKMLALRGFLAGTTGDLKRAEESLRQAVAGYDRLVAGGRPEAALRGERARALERLGSILGQRPENFPEVDRLWIEALAVDRAILAEDPRSPARRPAVAGDLGRLSFLRGIEGRIEEALVFSGEALTVAAQIAAEDPDDFEAQRNVAMLRGRRSVDLIDVGRVAEAEREARGGLAAVEELFERDPSNVTVEVLVAAAHQAVGGALLADARRSRDREPWRAARQELSQALAIYERLIARGALAKNLSEAAEAETTRALIAECDRALASGAAGTATRSPSE